MGREGGQDRVRPSLLERMRIARLKRLVAVAVVAVAVLLALTHVASLVLEQRAVDASARLQRLTLLAAEMRQSSNELTRLSRSNVVMGDPRFRVRYFEVLDIRAGRRPRPPGYEVSSWDIERPPLRGGTPRSLLALLRDEHVAPEAFDMLAESLAESEALARLEIEVMDRTAALLASGTPSLDDRMELVVRLHDREYQLHKVRIMEGLDRFEHAVGERAAMDLARVHRQQRFVLVVGLGVIGVMIVAFAAFARYTNDAILSPLESLGLAADRMAAGDYTTRAGVRVANEIGMLAETFDRMAGAIESDVAERERMRAEMEVLARVDALTGVSNRRAFTEAAASELVRARRYARPAAVAMIDVDHFKRINDEYGHPIGDAVLRHLGLLLRDHVRDLDLVGRLGGEEFALFLPEIGADDAARVAERLRKSIEECSSVMTECETVRFTASIGVAVVDEPDLGLPEILRRADTALYRAKRDGRNRVRTWTAGQSERPTIPGIKPA